MSEFISLVIVLICVFAVGAFVGGAIVQWCHLKGEHRGGGE